MTITLKGIYRDGKIDLPQKPAVPEGTEVLVTIESPSSESPAPQGIHLGMFSGGPSTEWDDFRKAKQIWEPKDL